MTKYSIFTIVIIVIIGCGEPPLGAGGNLSVDTLEVTATAYNSLQAQTKKGDPTLAAWGDHLELDVKAIAVSRDLIKMGLDHNTRLKIEGMNGIYRVKDKMNRRWSKKIDIYMGTDKEKALEWGKKKVRIYYEKEAYSK